MHRSSTPRSWTAVALTLACGLATSLPPAGAQQSGYGQTMGSSPMEQQLYNYDPGNGSRPNGSSGLNPANPLDLINKIRKGSAMDNATPPGDAVDQALKELETQSRPQPAATGPLVTKPQPSGTGATP
ncbi:MAG: hypothetical protein VKP63_05360 [Cyanobacteriota bacterium]|nr:hypothetical protein [Cyanobacteriota bacterium]